MHRVQTNLGKRQRRDEIDEEIGAQVAGGDHPGVQNELALAENPGAGRDEGGAELDHHVQEVEGVGERAEARDDDPQPEVRVHALRGRGRGRGSPRGDEHRGQVEEERVDEEREQARYQEELVPFPRGMSSGIQ